MNQSKKLFYILTISIFMSASVKATSTAPTHPCKNVETACLAAGYLKQTNNTFKKMNKCINPLLKGRTVATVQVKAEDIKACRSKIGAALNK